MSVVPNGRTRIAIIERGRCDIFKMLGAHFQPLLKRYAYLLHWVVRMEIDANNFVENKIKKERRRSSNAGSFLTTAQLANHMIISFAIFLEMVRHGLMLLWGQGEVSEAIQLSDKQFWWKQRCFGTKNINAPLLSRCYSAMGSTPSRTCLMTEIVKLHDFLRLVQKRCII